MPHIGQTSTKGPEEKIDLQEMTGAENLQSIDSSIESCLKILRQEIRKRAELTDEAGSHWYLSGMDEHLRSLEHYFKDLTT